MASADQKPETGDQKRQQQDSKRSRRVAREWDCKHEFLLLHRDCVEFLRAVGVSLRLKCRRETSPDGLRSPTFVRFRKRPPPDL
jgi:hypothetical protein